MCQLNGTIYRLEFYYFVLNVIRIITCITQKFDDGTIWSPTVSVYIRITQKSQRSDDGTWNGHNLHWIEDLLVGRVCGLVRLNCFLKFCLYFWLFAVRINSSAEWLLAYCWSINMTLIVLFFFLIRWSISLACNNTCANDHWANECATELSLRCLAQIDFIFGCRRWCIVLVLLETYLRPFSTPFENSSDDTIINHLAIKSLWIRLYSSSFAVRRFSLLSLFLLYSTRFAARKLLLSRYIFSSPDTLSA